MSDPTTTKEEREQIWAALKKAMFDTPGLTPDKARRIYDEELRRRRNKRYADKHNPSRGKRRPKSRPMTAEEKREYNRLRQRDYRAWRKKAREQEQKHEQEQTVLAPSKPENPAIGTDPGATLRMLKEMDKRDEQRKLAEAEGASA